MDAGHIGLVGSSAGAEAALVIAATYPEIKAVVAIAPSSVVWQGYATSPKPIYTAEPKSAWTLMGKPFPFVPFIVPSVVNFQGEIYANSLHVASHEAAIIPVERINCPILLMSGTDDRSWPSDEMARELVDRPKRTRFRFPYEHLSYPNAGHAFFSARDLSSDPKAAEGVDTHLKGQSTNDLAVLPKAMSPPKLMLGAKRFGFWMTISRLALAVQANRFEAPNDRLLLARPCRLAQCNKVVGRLMTSRRAAQGTGRAAHDPLRT